MVGRRPAKLFQFIAVNNEISLEVSQELNTKIMRLFDTSSFCEDVENYLVEVLPAGRSVWVPFHVQKGFSLVLNSSNLRYKKVISDLGLIDLPDGIYEIKQSYKPNIQTLVKYYHFRHVTLLLKYIEKLCQHFSKKCDLEKKQFEEITETLTLIRHYIDAAKYEVEIYHEKEKGIDYYNKAVEMLKKLDENGCGCL